MPFTEYLRLALEKQERERDRVWGLLLPLGAAFTTVSGYVLLHFPPISTQTILSILTFGMILYIPVDAMLRALLAAAGDALRSVTDREEAQILKAFKKLPSRFRYEDFDRAARVTSFAGAAAASLVLGLWSEDEFLKPFILVGSVVFIAVALFAILPPEIRIRRAKKRIRKLGQLTYRTIRVVVTVLKWILVAGFSVATLVAIAATWESGVERGLASAGLIAMVVFSLAILRTWAALSLAFSTTFLSDLLYEVEVKRMPSSTGERCFEGIDILRERGLYFTGSAREFAEAMGFGESLTSASE